MLKIEIDSLINNELEKTNTTKKINIDAWVDCFIVIDSKNTKIIKPTLNKIVDLILENINKNDVYKNFSVILENINYFLKNLQEWNNQDWIDDINIMILITEWNNIHFSKIWESSFYLINNSKELLEISDEKKNKEFNYVSSWKISPWEKIIISSKNIIKELNPSDIKELSKIEDWKELNENIIKILKEEWVKSNIDLISILPWDKKQFNKNISKEKLKNYLYYFVDNKLWKKIYALYLLYYNKINIKSKLIKNIFFISGIIISWTLLFMIISWVINSTQISSKASENKLKLIEAREYVWLASQNIWNVDMFNLNIQKAEELIESVISSNLFKSETDLILSEIATIKKQMNWVETFIPSNTNKIIDFNFNNPIKILIKNKKLFVLEKNRIIGPIIWWQNPWVYNFSEITNEDLFIDASVVWNDIMILTNNSRIVKFWNDNKFSYVNIIWAEKWPESKIIKWYNSNIYLTNKESNQIYRHKTVVNWFTSWDSYLKESDSSAIWKILAMWIDGGIYLLKNDLTVVKFFSNPYRIEKIVLNSLPTNYNYEWWKTDIVTSAKYVYFLLNNKIWIFEPNSTRFMDTKSLKYLWQIEWQWEEIISFDVPRDGEINILTKNWVYKINIEIWENNIRIK